MTRSSSCLFTMPLAVYMPFCAPTIEPTLRPSEARATAPLAGSVGMLAIARGGREAHSF
jgi:hypothetical protein